MKYFSEEEKIKILSDMIAIKSVNENEIEVANYLKDLFAQYGIESKIVPVTDTRVNLVAEIGSGSPVIGISGHMDVVSPGDENEWTSDPFTLTERDGKLYGRGTNDMKAGLINLALVMIELKENNELKKGTVRFMATTGEEVGGAGWKKLYDKGYMEDVEYLWVAEPSHDTIIYAHKGSLNSRVTSIGEATHSSMPEHGYNPINPLMKYLLEVDENRRRARRIVVQLRLLQDPGAGTDQDRGGHREAGQDRLPDAARAGHQGGHHRGAGQRRLDLPDRHPLHRGRRLDPALRAGPRAAASRPSAS